MCLYPRLIINKKYTATKKNNGIVPIATDERVKYIPVGCQNCIECRKQKAREWQVRLLEDIKEYKNGKFITLTFSNESIKELDQEIDRTIDGYRRDNEIATIAVRRWLERWRKEYKISLRHWLITEIGGQGTENIHLHGIIWTNEKLTTVENIWKYGYMWKGKGEKQINYVNESTVSYITKYVNKIDEIHKHYKPKILCSPGIGKRYTEQNYNSKKNAYNYNNDNKQTDETYRTSSGHKITLPVYWRNKIYTEEEREKLWIEKLDKQVRWIRGEKINISKGEEEYFKLLKWHQRQNTELGYGNDNKTQWSRKEYERIRRNMMRNERINNTKTPRRRGSKT